MTSTKINNKKKYKNLVVTKPWGSEYIACENNTTATWLLEIKKNHKTSLDCHPKKKTGFKIFPNSAFISSRPPILSPNASAQ